MSQMFTTDSTRHFYAIDGGNTSAPAKRKRALASLTHTVVAVAVEGGITQYDVVERPMFCQPDGMGA